MRASNSLSHHELASLCLPSSVSPRIDPSALTGAAEHLGRCTTGHVLEHLGIPITMGNQMAVAKHLRSLGYVKARVRIGRNLHWVFFPPQDVTS
jgi:hypothetical protein